MSYAQQYGLAVDATFQQQILVAMMNQCAVVLTESTGTPGHTLRAQFAIKVLEAPTSFQPQFAFAAITQGGIVPLTVPSTVPDVNVQTAVSNVWNALSGYFPN